jgi:hypothetical protein
MNGLRIALSITFLLATVVGIAVIISIAATVTHWVLFPFVVITSAFVTYFLGEGVK